MAKEIAPEAGTSSTIREEAMESEPGRALFAALTADTWATARILWTNRWGLTTIKTGKTEEDPVGVEQCTAGKFATK